MAESEWVHNDGSPCADWHRCDTYEHHRPDGTETITKIRARQPEPAQFEHEDGSICKHGTDMASCPNQTHWYKGDGPTSWAAKGRDVSDTVDELIDGRVDVYGDPVMCFTRHAQVWSGILGIEVQPWQVALCMLGYKLVRTGITPDYSDNSDDIEGYLDIFRQLMPDMVQARDTAEYLAGGGQGARA